MAAAGCVRGKRWPRVSGGGTDPGSQVYCAPGGDASGRPGLGGSAANGCGGTRDIAGSELCPWLEVTLDGSVFLLPFRSLLFVEKGTRCSHVCGPPTVCPASAAREADIARHRDKPT